MSRTNGLLDLLQLLRNRSTLVTGPDLAAEPGISIQTRQRALDFGFIFVAEYPDGHRFRVFDRAADPR